ncbi:MAG: hypothetical protein ABJ251_10520, partial [Paracoccaceae bacterium]
RSITKEKEHKRRKTIEVMEQCQPANRDTPSNVRDTSLSAKRFGTWSAKPSGPAAVCAAQTGRTHDCI